MTNKILLKVYQKAKDEGRICERCGWIITKKNWDKGYRKLCGACYDALKGVHHAGGHSAYEDEMRDRTGEM